MRPLLKPRDALDIEDDRHLRDYRRMNGILTVHRDQLVHGPYTQAAREGWLRTLLTAQTNIRTWPRPRHRPHQRRRASADPPHLGVPEA
ncbi:hypothetical protein [Streptomyces sp. SM12]|uniref:hypothetical protein n=1 Tax=Streptomyces sp. SM12 TaxID=1071602 RepID=UPI000CD54597|nr:hypothetical protein [Streptomyces sp. SM12]